MEQTIYFACQRQGVHLLDAGFATDLVGISRKHAVNLLASMAQKDALHRVGRGRYAVIPPDVLYGRRSYVADPHLILDELMQANGVDGLYYVAYQSAAAIHGAAHQLPFALLVAIPQQRRPIELGRARIQFVQLKPEKLFGFQQIHYHDVPLNVSDLRDCLCLKGARCLASSICPVRAGCRWISISTRSAPKRRCCKNGQPSVRAIRRMTNPQAEDRTSLRARRLEGVLGAGLGNGLGLVMWWRASQYVQPGLSQLCWWPVVVSAIRPLLSYVVLLLVKGRYLVSPMICAADATPQWDGVLAHHVAADHRRLPWVDRRRERDAVGGAPLSIVHVSSPLVISTYLDPRRSRFGLVRRAIP